ncbi:MAG: GNAT family N-acetyltransferase [Alcanivoracaceae bacterium]|nr:GNAT family N-acetyltransferase [Alcanivoracaceae bacterium]
MFEPLTSGRIVLAKYKLRDSLPIYQAIKNSLLEISPWATWLSPNYSLKSAEDFVALQMKNWTDNIEFSFTIKDIDNSFLGVISLHIFDPANNVANIGYWINSQYIRKGYCTEAVQLLVVNAFKQLNLIRIELIAGVNNIASQRVAEKAGAQFEGILKNRIRPNGMASDARLYAFINEVYA